MLMYFKSQVWNQDLTAFEDFLQMKFADSSFHSCSWMFLFLKHFCSFYVVWKQCFPDELVKLFHWSLYAVTVQCLLICCFCEFKVANQKLIFISYYRSFKRTYCSDKKSRKSWSCFDMEPSHSWGTKWIYPKLHHTL